MRISLKSKRDEGMLELLLGSLDPSLRLAFDFEHPSWDGIEPRLSEAGAVRVGDLEHPAPFRYLRRREAPDKAFAAAVAAAQEPVYVYFRHDDEPAAPAPRRTAPRASRARRLLPECTPAAASRADQAKAGAGEHGLVARATDRRSAP